MRGLTIKLPDEMLRKLADEARASGQSVASVVRARLEAESGGEGSVHAQAADLAGVLAGGKRSAANERRKFRRA